METKLAGPNDVLSQIKQILVDEMQLNLKSDIPDDYSLLDGGLALDSILIAELIARIEDRLGLDLRDQVLQSHLLDSLSRLAQFVAKQYEEAHGGVQHSQSEGAVC